MFDSLSVPSIEARQFGVKQFNQIQEEILTLEAKDKIVLAAKPGAGKTIAAGIWISRLRGQSEKSFIYCAPFRSLCQQVAKVLSSFEDFPEVKCILGGDEKVDPLSLLKEDTVVVCTPEVAVQYYSSLPLPLVIDEVHLLFDENRGYLIDLLIRKWKDRPLLCMSGTLGETSRADVMGLIGKSVLIASDESSFLSVNLLPKMYEGRNPNVATVSQLLLTLASTAGKVLCFVGSKQYGKLLLEDIKKRSPLTPVAFHMADLDYETRDRYEEEFKSGDIKILLHTQTLVSGIDFDVTAGVIAQVRTGMGEIPVYDIVQAASRVGRRRPGSVAVFLPSKMSWSDYRRGIQEMRCGDPPSRRSLDPWTASLWAAWGLEIGLSGLDTCPVTVYDVVAEARRKLGGDLYSQLLYSGISPDTMLGLLRASATIKSLLAKAKEKGIDPRYLNPAYCSSFIAEAFYKVPEIKAKIRWPIAEIIPALNRAGNFDVPGGKYKAQLADAMYRARYREAKADKAHYALVDSIRSIVDRASAYFTQTDIYSFLKDTLRLAETDEP